MTANELWRILLYVGNRELTVAQLSELLFGMQNQDAELCKNFDAVADEARGNTYWLLVNERRSIIGGDYVWDLLKNGKLELSGQLLRDIAEYIDYFGADEDLYQEEAMTSPITVGSIRALERAKKNLYKWEDIQAQRRQSDVQS